MSNISWSTFNYAGSLPNITIKSLAATKDGSIIAVTSSGSQNNYLTYKISTDRNGNFLDPNTWQKLSTKSYRYDSRIPTQSEGLTPYFRSISNLYSANYLIDPSYLDTNLIPSVFASIGDSSDKSYQIVGLSGENIWISNIDLNSNSTNNNSMSSTHPFNYGSFRELRKAVMIRFGTTANTASTNATINPGVAFTYKLNGTGIDNIIIVGLTGYTKVDPFTNKIYQTNYWRGIDNFSENKNYQNTGPAFGWQNSTELKGVMSTLSKSIDDLASNYPQYYNTPNTDTNGLHFLLATSYSTNAIRKVPVSIRLEDPNFYETSYINESGITGVKNITFGNGFFVATPYATTNKIFFTSGSATGWKGVAVSGLGNIDFRNSHSVFSNGKFVVVCNNNILESSNPSTGWSVSSFVSANLKQDQNIIWSSVTGRPAIYAGINQDGSILIGKEKTNQSINLRIPSEVYPGTKIYLPPTTNVSLPVSYSISDANILNLDLSGNTLTTLSPGTSLLYVYQSGDSIYNPINQEYRIDVASFTPSSSTFSWSENNINLSGLIGPYELSCANNVNGVIITNHAPSTPLAGLIQTYKNDYITSDPSFTGSSLSINQGWFATSRISGRFTNSLLCNGTTMSSYADDGYSSYSQSLAYFSDKWIYHNGAPSTLGTYKWVGDLGVVYQLKSYFARTYLTYPFNFNSGSQNMVFLYDLRTCTSLGGPYECMSNHIAAIGKYAASGGRLAGYPVNGAAINSYSTLRKPVNILYSSGTNKISVAENTIYLDGGLNWRGQLEPIIDSDISGVSYIAYDDAYDLFLATSNQTGRNIYYSLTGDVWGKVDIGSTINFKNSSIVAGQGKYTIFAKNLDNTPLVLTSSSPGGPWNFISTGLSPFTNSEQRPVYVDRTFNGEKSIFAIISSTGNKLAYTKIKNATKLNSTAFGVFNRIPSSPTIGSTFTFSNLRTNDFNQTGILNTSDSSIVSVDQINRRFTVNKKGSVQLSITTTGTEVFDPLILRRTLFPKLSQNVIYTVPFNVNVGSSYAIYLSSSVGLPVSYVCSDPDFVFIDTTRGTLTIRQPGKTATITVSQAGDDTYDSYVATYTISAPKGNQTLVISIPNILQVGQEYNLPSTSLFENIPIIYSSLNTSIANIISGNKLIANRCGEFLINAMNTGNAFYNPLNMNYLYKTNTGCSHLSTAYIPPVVQINSIYSLPSVTNANRIINYTLTNSGIGRFLYSGMSTSVTGLQITGYGNSTALLSASSDSYYSTYSASYAFNSYKQFQSFNWSVPTGITVGARYLLSTTTNQGLPLSYSSSNPSSIAIVGSELIATGVGSANISANAPESNLYEPFSTSRPVQAFKVSQTGSGFKNIPRISPVGSSYMLEQFTNAGLPITYASSNSGVARIRVAGNTYLDVINAGKSEVTAFAPETQIYEPYFTNISLETFQLVALSTGNLTVLSGFEVVNDAHIPSGYTTSAFLPTVNDSQPFGAAAFTRTFLNNDGTETTFPKGPGAITATGSKGVLIFNPLNSGQFNRHIQTQKWALYTGNNLFAPLIKASDFIANSTGIVTPFSWSPVVGPIYVQGRLEVYEIDERFEHIEKSGAFALLNHEKVGFGTYTPTEKMHVEGNMRIDGGYINPVTGNNVIFNITGILV